MSRPRIPAGELGNISFTLQPDGTFVGRAQTRSDDGERHRLRGVGADEHAVREILLAKAARLSSTFVEELGPNSMLSRACEVWLAEVRAYGQVESSTLQAYENNVRHLVVPICGGIMLKDLTPGRCDRILQNTMRDKSNSAASRLRKTLSQVMSLSVRHGAITANPMREVRRVKGSRKRNSALTVEQLSLVRTLIRQWRSASGQNHDVKKLEDGMDIMLGTSARVGEVMALRRQDVDVVSNVPSILIDGTLRQTRAEGLHRKDSAKHMRQRRRVVLPAFALAAVSRRLALAGPASDDYLFATSSGRPFSVSNFERLLRDFIGAHSQVLESAGINIGEFSTHMFRRTAATIVERAGGITLSSRLLGHASEAVTRASYVVTAEEVDPATATILNNAFGGTRTGG